MVMDERTRRIKEHLAKSSDNASFNGSSSIEYKAPTSAPSIPEERKRRMREHLDRSTNQFGGYSIFSDRRKQQIMDHLRASKG